MKTTKKILIVEDDLNYLSVLQQAFGEEGFTVVSARDGAEGLALAQTENPDLIILDIMLPKMDGIEAAKKIKESNIAVPIIFLTNLGDTNSINKAMESAKLDLEYIVKVDVHIDKIISRVKEKLGISSVLAVNKKLDNS
jgi:two-component system alkaline phosphatase synthesis response regulator PhoP